jgi:hypothetical protein
MMWTRIVRDAAPVPLPALFVLSSCATLTRKVPISIHLLSSALLIKTASLKWSQSMRHLRKSRREKYKKSQRAWPITWYWKSQQLSIHQRAWLGVRERDSYQPPTHYNLHVQALCGGPDYHNYHIRYLGIRDSRHNWSVVDVRYGREQSRRVYSCSHAHAISDVIDAVSHLLASDILSDIGDATLWLSLIEHLPLVLFDLYQQGPPIRPQTRSVDA